MSDEIEPSAETGDGFSYLGNLASDTSNIKFGAVISVATVLEVFVVMMIAHFLGGYLLGPQLRDMLPSAPYRTIGMLSSSTFSPVVAIVYGIIRFKFRPRVYVTKTSLSYAGLGCLLSLSVGISSFIVLGTYMPVINEIWSYNAPYFLISTLLLTIIGPALEEVIFRGYMFELAQRKCGSFFALIIVSFLFFLFHGIWGDFSLSTVFIFVFSVVFSFVYIKGGLLASIASHASANCFLFFVFSFW